MRIASLLLAIAAAILPSPALAQISFDFQPPAAGDKAGSARREAVIDDAFQLVRWEGGFFVTDFVGGVERTTAMTISEFRDYLHSRVLNGKLDPEDIPTFEKNARLETRVTYLLLEAQRVPLSYPPDPFKGRDEIERRRRARDEMLRLRRLREAGPPVADEPAGSPRAPEQRIKLPGFADRVSSVPDADPGSEAPGDRMKLPGFADPVQEVAAGAEGGPGPSLIDRMRRGSAGSGIGPSRRAIAGGSAAAGMLPWNRADEPPPEEQPVDGSIPVPLFPVPPAAVGPSTGGGGNYGQWMTGSFDTNFGIMTLSPGGGSYTYNDGTITVTSIDGAVMEGTWRQSGTGSCPGNTVWGKFRFTFTETGFSGRWGHCDVEPANSGWSGTRK